MIKIPFISICIPAYKNPASLKRLLESISIQTFTDFEVIITDDSNDNSVTDSVNSMKWNFLLSYFKNEKSLGSPKNWNEVVNHAKGEWIKMMHHDDWFGSKSALKVFVQEIRKQQKHSFFFCAYQNIAESGEIKKMTPPADFLRKLVLKNPEELLAGNIIGPPSVTIYKNDKSIFYDPALQWLVDVDFYIRYLKNAEPFYIDAALINIGVHEEQVTKYSFLKPEIEIPEHLIVLNKLGENSLKNIRIYDAFWRLVRNLKITSEEQFSSFNKHNIFIPEKLTQIIRHQKKLPSALLTFGLFSKITMLFSYLFNTNK